MSINIEKPENTEDKFYKINNSINYTAWSVFAIENREGLKNLAQSDINNLLSQLDALEITIRGFYDISLYRAEADLMIWWHSPDEKALQKAYNIFLSSAVGQYFSPYWSGVGVHRQAEFNSKHVPAFLLKRDALDYLCVYPFVRSYNWYLLPEAERSVILRDHGQHAAEYPDVHANTVASFALGDYEWLLAFEAEKLHRIVDLMRHMRSTKARLYVREEIPFFTGKRTDFAEYILNLQNIN